MPTSIYEDKPVQLLDLRTKNENALLRAGIRTLGELKVLTTEQLEEILEYYYDVREVKFKLGKYLEHGATADYLNHVA